MRKLLPAALALVAAAGLSTVPASASTPDPVYPILQPADLLAYFLSPTNLESISWNDPSQTNKNFMPDWNHNGVYREEADVTLDQADADMTGPFRYPCLNADGTVTYQTTSGTCVADGTAGADFVLGEARRVHFVDAAGYELAATFFAPAGTSKVPAVVFAPGGWSSNRLYYMYGMAGARYGYLTMHVDFEGTGGSEGDPGEDAPVGPCLEARRCKQVQDSVRWLVDANITPLPNGSGSGTHNPAYQPTGDNPHNPMLSRVDTAKVSVMGQSGGSHAVLNYPYMQDTGLGYDGRPLPKIKAAVGLSGFPQTKASVPIQAQTADLDLPGVTATNGFGHTNGPIGTKDWYEKLRATKQGSGALDLIVIESGSHGDTTNLSALPRVAWSQHLTTYYAFNFLDCHVRADSTACDRSRSPQPHLSRAVASEYDPDGPAGSSPSRCITIPDKSTLEQLLDPWSLLWGLAGQPLYTCTP